MVQIMEHAHTYVPFVPYTEERCISNGDKIDVTKAVMHKIIFGGDQLTVARMRSAQRSRLNGETPLAKLNGLVPVAEDWHTKANFLGVSMLLKGKGHATVIHCHKMYEDCINLHQ